MVGISISPAARANEMRNATSGLCLRGFIDIKLVIDDIDGSMIESFRLQEGGLLFVVCRGSAWPESCNCAPRPFSLSLSSPSTGKR